MRFEKWQALGNDYILIEERDLPWPLTPARIRRLCHPHLGIGGDGILLLSEATEPKNVARLRIHNPDGSEAELSGNGAREAIMYLRRSGATSEDSFTLETPAGELHPTITSQSTCRVEMGAAALRSPAFPSGDDTGRASLQAAGRSWAFQHVAVGNPQCAIRVDDLAELEALDLAVIGPQIERHESFPQRTNVSFYCALGAERIRARIFERGVGETLSSGTGATGAALAFLLEAGQPPRRAAVTVVLDGGELLVEADERLSVTLTGWALPIYSATLADELIEELHETQ